MKDLKATNEDLMSFIKLRLEYNRDHTNTLKLIILVLEWNEIIESETKQRGKKENDRTTKTNRKKRT